MASQTPEAIARWAEGKAKPPAPTPAYRRMTASDLAVMLKLHKDGLTQVQIAQRLGCDQKTVSRWLADCQDTTKEASAYLRGSALKMARNIVAKGRASDHIKALEGLSVLTPDQKPGIVVQIGIKADGVRLLELGGESPSPHAE